MNRISLIILLTFNFSLIVRSQNSLNDLNIVFNHDFENNTLGDYLEGEWSRDWLSPSFSIRQSETDIVQEVNDLVNPTNTLQINYTAGTVGQANNGASWHTPINRMDEVYVSYDLMFMPGFQFQLGGKLPSVQGGNVDAGVKPNGYDGFTGGLMFHKEGLLYFYVYYPDSKDPNYGDSFLWGSDGYTADDFSPSKVVVEYGSGNVSVCTPGEWHNITYRMVLNTVKPEGGGNYDGIMEAYFDGKLVTQISQILFRHTTDIGIDCMRLYSFFGGSGDEWKTPIDEWLRVDNVVLYTFQDNIDVPRGNELSPTDRTINYWRQFSAYNTEPPASPTALSTSSISSSTVGLKWTDNSKNEYGFKIYRSSSANDGFTEIGTTNTNITSFTDKYLQPSTTYYYTIRSFNDIGYSEYTSALSVSTSALQLPAAPSGLVSTSVQYTTTSLKWNDNSNNETGFEVERSGPNDTEIKNIFNLDAGNTVFTDVDLAMNSTYQYRIRSFNLDGYSDFSAQIEITTPYIEPPSTPTSLKSTDFTDKSISVSWKDNSDNEDGFIIVRSLATDASHSESITVDANDTSYIDTELLSSTSYIYTVRAINFAGKSGTSNKNVATTLSVAETKRVKDGLIAYYNFGFDPDFIIHDQSSFGEPLNLRVAKPNAVSWEPSNKLKIQSGTVLVSTAPANKIIDALKKTNEITIECWIKPLEPEFSTRSRIISLSSNDNEIGFLLDQDYSGNADLHSLTYGVRMQTESTNSSGYPEFIPDLGNIPFINLQHLAYVRDSLGKEVMYINGIKSSEGFRPSDFSTWNDDFYLKFGNESDLKYPWKGTFYSVAIYKDALTQIQVNRNYSLGPCDSIRQDGLDYEISVYPNPVTDLAVIEINPVSTQDYVPQTMIRVLDVFGKVYYQKSLFNPNSQFTETLDFRQYQKGIYLIQVISGNKQKSTKLIVQ